MRRPVPWQYWVRLVIAAAVISGVVSLASRWTTTDDNAVVEVAAPSQLSDIAQSGKAQFEARCSECHGQAGGGTNIGPPLIHRVYEAPHHADLAFRLAVQIGVRAHHWSFGDMPPQPDITGAEIAAITRYVREVQVANGVGSLSSES